MLEQWLEDGGVKALDRFTPGSPEVIGVMDRDYVIRYVNWTAPGLTRESVIGSSALGLVPPDYLDAARDAFDQALLHGRPGRFEMMYRGEQGVLVWVVRVGPIVHEGRVIGAFTVNTDATEERREGLDRDRLFLLSLDLLLVTSPTGIIRRANPAFGTTLGYTMSQMIGRPFIDFVHPDDVKTTMATFESLPSDRDVRGFENRYRKSDGSYRVLSWHSTFDPLTSDVYAVARDVTDQRTVEAQLRHAQKMEAVGQLAGGIAHDFNNLMQAVLANVEMALRDGPADDAEFMDHLREIQGAGRRAAELTKQLLLFSRLQPLNRTPIDLNELLGDLLRLLTRLLPENITIDFRPTHPLPSVNADRTQLEQVLLNLAVNARDAMEAGGTLTLETEVARFSAQDQELHPWVRPGHFVRLRVTDTGVGMPPDVRERAFDPFFTTKGPNRGTGLGLSTVYGIVEQHGGLVHLYSEVGRGTTFRVYLPVDEREPHAPPEVSRDEIPRARGGELLLVAEDEDAVRKPVLQLLEGAGYRTLAAKNGREAVEVFRAHQHEIALVVLDVVMPELGGPEAHDTIVAIRPGVPVLFMSGYADDRYRQRLPAGAEIVEKPFRMRELLARVRRKLDE